MRVPFQAEAREVDFPLLASYLKALAHPGRLELLWKLRAPRAPGEVELRPHRHDDLPSERAVSRQTVTTHLERLEEVGVVTRVPDAEGGAGRWVTSVPHLFALVEELRKLTAIPPSSHVDLEETVRRDAERETAWEPGRKLVLLTGPWEGRLFPLHGTGPWRVGRSRASSVALTFDPFVSGDHAEVRAGPEGHALAVGERARNPAVLNGARVAPGGSRPLRHGDAFTVGRSTLLFHER